MTAPERAAIRAGASAAAGTNFAAPPSSTARRARRLALGGGLSLIGSFDAMAARGETMCASPTAASPTPHTARDRDRAGVALDLSGGGGMRAPKLLAGKQYPRRAPARASRARRTAIGTRASPITSPIPKRPKPSSRVRGQGRGPPRRGAKSGRRILGRRGDLCRRATACMAMRARSVRSAGTPICATR